MPDRLRAWLVVLAAVTAGCGPRTTIGTTATGTNEATVIGMTWPETQIFPRFGPVTTLDVVETDGRSNGEITLLVTLQGLVNRRKPRIWVLEGGARRFFWLNQIGATRTNVAGPLPLVIKYRSEVSGIVVYDE